MVGFLESLAAEAWVWSASPKTPRWGASNAKLTPHTLNHPDAKQHPLQKNPPHPMRGEEGFGFGVCSEVELARQLDDS